MLASKPTCCCNHEPISPHEVQCGACNVTCATGQQCLGGTCQTVNEQPDKLARTANVKVNVLVKLAPGRTKCSSRGRSCYYPLFESNNNWWVQQLGKGKGQLGKGFYS